MSYPYYNTMKLRAERLFVVINVNTFFRCFLADAPRRTTQRKKRNNTRLILSPQFSHINFFISK